MSPTISQRIPDVDHPESSYGAISQGQTDGLLGNHDDGTFVLNQRRKAITRGAIWTMVIVTLAVGFIIAVVATKDLTRSSSSSVTTDSTDDYEAVLTDDESSTDFAKDIDHSVWRIYKHTTSIKATKVIEVAEFVNKYITSVSEVECLGCDSFKVVGEIGAPRDNGMTATQLHFVDSNVFHDTVEDNIGDWTDYITNEVGYDHVSPFHFNKYQMFVPDLTYVYKASESTTRILRKSKAAGSDEHNIAHVQLPVPHSGLIVDIVGPLSSITDTYGEDEVKEFDEFSDDECKDLQALSESLDYYTGIYDTGVFKYQDDWDNDNQYIPMGIKIINPMEDVKAVKGTLDLIKDVTGYEYQRSTSGKCEYYSMDFSSEDIHGIEVQYWYNKGLKADERTIGKWESEIMSLHNEVLNTSKATWNRYLDTHVGVMIENTKLCDKDTTFVAEMVDMFEAKDDFRYAMRDSGGVHFYTAPYGVRTWEFNTESCSEDITDICGCVADNSAVLYESIYSTTCEGIGDTIEDDAITTMIWPKAKE